MAPDLVPAISWSVRGSFPRGLVVADLDLAMGF